MQPHPPLKGHYSSTEAKPEVVNNLFDRGATYYDLLERWGFLNTSGLYRRQALSRHGLRPGHRLLDVASGTGLLAVQAVKILGGAENITCLDPSEGMLAVAREKFAANFVCARAERIPLPDNSFDFLTMGYALRHVMSLEEAFSEFRRVLVSGGKLLILEITKPDRPIPAFLFRMYFGRLFPVLAEWLTRSRDAHDMMRYYWETMEACVRPERVLDAMRSVGLREVHCRALFGLFTEYTAVKQ